MQKREDVVPPPIVWPLEDEAAQAESLALLRFRSPEDQVTSFFDSFGESAYRYIASSFGSDEDAEEVTQEAFLRLHQTLLRGDEEIGNPKAWIFSVARRLMLDRRKYGRHEQEKFRKFAQVFTAMWRAPNPSPEEALSKRRRDDSLRAALKSLTEIEKQCVYARAHGLKLREIAQVVGMDLRRVAEILERAVQKLQRQIRG